MPFFPAGLQVMIERNFPERHDDLHSPQQAELLADKRTAGLEFFRRRFIAGRGAAHGGADITIRQFKSIVSMLREGLIREAVTMQGFVQPVSAAVSGKDTAGSVPSVSGWRQSQDIKARVRIPESRNGATPVRPVAKLFPLFRGDRLPIGDKARTGRAAGNLIVEHVEGTHRAAQSTRQFRYDSSAWEHPLRGRLC